MPDKQQQIVQIHGELIRRVVVACSDPEQRQALDPVLRQSEANGWNELVAAIRKILDGNRSVELLKPLDADDQIIAEAILRGIQNPETLAETQLSTDPSLAAPGLAAMIDAAGKGDANALTLLANMAEQMVVVGGGMAKIGSLLRRMVNGERDPDALCRGLEPGVEKLVLNILSQLTGDDIH